MDRAEGIAALPPTTTFYRISSIEPEICRRWLMGPTPCVAALYPRTQRVNATGAVQPWLETMNHSRCSINRDARVEFMPSPDQERHVNDRVWQRKGSRRGVCHQKGRGGVSREALRSLICPVPRSSSTRIS